MWTSAACRRPRGAVADLRAPRLEVLAVRARGDLAVGVLARAARPRGRRSSPSAKPMSPVHSEHHAVGQARAAAAPPRRRRAAPRARRSWSRASTICTSSTLSNWCWRIMPRVSLPSAPASARKHGVYAVVADRQRRARRGSRRGAGW